MGVKCHWSPPLRRKTWGVWIDDKLKFTSHIGHAVAKSNQILELIKRSFVYRYTEIIKRLFTALVRPHVEYANSVWHPRFKKDVEQLEKVQRRATKLVTSLRDMSYQKRLQALHLPSLVYRRHRGDMIEVYKFIYGIYKSGHSLLPLAPSSALRGHIYKLKKRHCCTQLRSNFSRSESSIFGTIFQVHVVSAPSMNAFKDRLEGVLLYAGPEDFIRR